MVSSITPAASLSAGPATGFALMPDGASVLLLDGVHSLADGSLTKPMTLEGVVASVDPSGRYGLTLFEENILLWDLSSGQKAGKFGGSLNPPVHADFSPAGGAFVSASDRFARVWDIQAGKCVSKLKKHETQTTRARYSPDGERVLSIAQGDYAIKVWDAAQGQLLADLVCPVHEGNAPWMDAPMDAVWTADGSRIISAANYADVWDASSGQLLGELPSGGGFYSVLASAPDVQTLLATVFFMEGEQVSQVMLRAVNANTGEVSAEIQVGAAARLAVTPDGKHVVADAIDTIEVYALA